MTTPTLLTIPPGITALASEIPKLCATNWAEFKDAMELFFISSGADYLIDATASTTIPKECSRLDKQLIFHVWARVDDELKYLVKNSKTSTLLIWTTLLSHFQKSTMPRRIAARQQLYSVLHDPSKSIDVFINSVTTAAKVLADLGYMVEETEIKDIILMKLDDSYATVRTSIMTAKEEPDLDTITALLSSASSSFPIPTPQVSPVANVASSFKAKKFNHSSSSPSHQVTFVAGPNGDAISTNPLPPPDDKGFQWCQTSNTSGCHRCGRPNHIAAHCIFNMPQHVKDWVMNGGYKKHTAAIADTYEDFEYEEEANIGGWLTEPPDWNPNMIYT